MADVITSQPQSVAVAAAPQWGVATRKYAVEAIGAFFLTFAVGVAALSGSVFVPLAAGAMLMVMISGFATRSRTGSRRWPAA